MTALLQYERLEASGLWRAAPGEQRREVIVSLGDASLTITDMQDRALTHWSLAALERANPGETPAIYHPDGDPGETLELSADATEMLEAIERLHRVIERRRPKPGRLRLILTLSAAAVIAALAFLWMPGALLRHTVSVIPDVKRTEIGEALLSRITRVSGQPCSDRYAQPALEAMSQRLLGNREALVVLPGGVQETAHLPGGTILMNRALVEDFEDADVPAGYVIAEALRADRRDPLETLLQSAGFWSSLRLLTRGELTPETLDAQAERILTAPSADIPDAELVAAFTKAKLRTTPYAFARDVSGESVLGLIEADPSPDGSDSAVLSDSNWIRLQTICGG